MLITTRTEIVGSYAVHKGRWPICLLSASEAGPWVRNCSSKVIEADGVVQTHGLGGLDRIEGLGRSCLAVGATFANPDFEIIRSLDGRGHQVGLSRMRQTSIPVIRDG
jgi:hypothetical protein